MLDLKLTKLGTLTMKDGVIIAFDGFEAEGATCREVAILACIWAIGELQQELTETIAEAGGGISSVD